MTDTPEDKRREATTLAKGLTVLRAFGPRDEALGNREIARRTGLHTSTISRMTYTLVRHGFLIQLSPSEAFRLGPAAIAIGHVARQTYPSLRLADPLMQALANDASALVAAGMIDGEAVMLTRVWRPEGRPAIWLEEGHRLPVGTSAPGRVLRALGPAIAGGDAEAAARDRATLAAHGYLVSLGGWNPQVNACAVPLAAPGADIAMAFLCGAAAAEMGEARIRTEIGPALLARVATLRAAAGMP